MGKLVGKIFVSGLVSLSLVACGSSKTSVGQKPPEKQSSDKGPSTGVPDAPSQNGESGNPPTDQVGPITPIDPNAPAQPSNPNQPFPSLPSPGPDGPNAPKIPNTPSVPNIPVVISPPPNSKNPVVVPPPTEEFKLGDVTRVINVSGEKISPIGNYEPNSPENIDTSVAPILTGALTKNDLAFTGSSTESLLTTLRIRNQKIDEASRVGNQKLAAAVVAANISDDFKGNLRTIQVLLKQPNGKTLYTFSASGKSQLLKLDAVEPSQNAMNVTAKLLCIDKSEACVNSLLRLRVSSSNQTLGVVNIILRNSDADLYANYNDRDFKSENAKRLVQIIKDSTVNRRNRERLNLVNFKSFEVVNGRAGFQIEFRTTAGSSAHFTGPLVVAKDSAELNLDLMKYGEMEFVADYSNLLGSKSNGGMGLVNAKLVANNGLGILKLQLDTGVETGKGAETFFMTIMRQIESSFELSEADYQF